MFSLPKTRRMNKKNVERVFANGVILRRGELLLAVLPNDLPYSRVAAVVSRRISKKSVVRNKIKRMTKEAFRNVSPLLGKNYDIVIMIKKFFSSQKEIEEKLRRIFQSMIK